MAAWSHFLPEEVARELHERGPEEDNTHCKRQGHASMDGKGQVTRRASLRKDMIWLSRDRSLIGTGQVTVYYGTQGQVSIAGICWRGTSRRRDFILRDGADVALPLVEIFFSFCAIVLTCHFPSRRALPVAKSFFSFCAIVLTWHFPSRRFSFCAIVLTWLLPSWKFSLCAMMTWIFFLTSSFLHALFAEMGCPVRLRVAPKNFPSTYGCSRYPLSMVRVKST